MSLPIGPITEEWCSDHFDFTAPELGDHLYEALGHMRSHGPVARTDAHGGQCLATRLFHEIIHAPADEIEAINDMATDAGIAEPIRYHNAFNRAPLTVPSTFTPGSSRLG